MAAKIKTKNYSVTGRVVAIVDIEMQATSLEEAVQKAAALDTDDFVTIQGSEFDSSLTIVAVSNPDGYET